MQRHCGVSPQMQAEQPQLRWTAPSLFQCRRAPRGATGGAPSPPPSSQSASARASPLQLRWSTALGARVRLVPLRRWARHRGDDVPEQRRPPLGQLCIRPRALHLVDVLPHKVQALALEGRTIDHVCQFQALGRVFRRKPCAQHGSALLNNRRRIVAVRGLQQGQRRVVGAEHGGAHLASVEKGHELLHRDRVQVPDVHHPLPALPHARREHGQEDAGPGGQDQRVSMDVLVPNLEGDIRKQLGLKQRLERVPEALLGVAQVDRGILLPKACNHGEPASDP
mmetsp:Transcript_101601/g.291659  ORF Transcript_101601/g.291659 Transcript_101601/m.291659 type:complete len:281 (-) Transcript_101601:520-1362(-)